MEVDRKVYLFDGSNWQNWSFRMEVHLEELGLLACIEQPAEEVPEFQVLATDTAPVKLEKEKKLAERKVNDVKCKSVLIRNIADSQLEYVKQKRTPVEIWRALENAFARKGVSGQFFLLKKLSGMKFEESGSMEEHLLVFDRIVRDLQSAGINLDERLVVFYLLQTMPRSYGQLVTVLETLSDDQCTLDFVRARLLNESVKRANSDDVGVERESSAFAGKSFGKSGKLKCFSCGKLGHKQAVCPNREEESSAKEKKKKNVHKGKAHVGEEVAFVSSLVSGSSVGSANDSQDSAVTWILDSGASDHMVGARDWLRDVKQLDDPVMIKVASGQVLKCNHSGTVDMTVNIGKKQQKCVVNDVLYVPGLRYNLFSIRRVGLLGMEVVFGKNSAVIKRDGEVVCTAKRKDSLYEMDAKLWKVKGQKALVSEKNCGMSDEELWHRRYGHIGKTGLLKLVSEDMVKGIVMKKSETPGSALCEPCLKGKQTRRPFIEMPLPRSTRPLELIHSDVCGGMKPAAWNGKRYYVSFTDDYTHFTAVYILHTKDEVYDSFQTFVAMAESHFDSRISRLRCDNGGEYVGNKFRDFCRLKGIQLEYTVPYTPQQNGVSERLNRTIMDKARAMIEDAEMDKKMWCEAVLTAVFIINRSPTAALPSGKTPYEMWYGHKPDVSKFRIFGSRAYSFVPKEKRNKLESRSKSCVFVGYGVNGYRLWDGRKIFIGRDVVVDETAKMSAEGGESSVKSPSSGPVELSGPSWLPVRKVVEVPVNPEVPADPEGPVGPEVPADPEVPVDPEAPVNTVPVVPDVPFVPVVPIVPVVPEVPASSSRSVRMPAGVPVVPEIAGQDEDDNYVQFRDVQEVSGDEQFSDCEDYLEETDPLELRRSGRIRNPPPKLSDYSCIAYALNAESYVDNLPSTIEELRKRDDWPEWKVAVDEELKSLADNETWQLVDLPIGRKPVACKWVFRLKTNPDGTIHKRKARLVAKGFTQRYGYDFHETYAPVIKMSTVRMMLALANHHGFVVHQMDVKAAFLNGVLTEDIYMRQPEGFEEGEKVCKLRKSIYGLKQSSKTWNDRFDEFVKKIGFRSCVEDSCLYVRQGKSGPVYLVLYVDDALIMSKDLREVEAVKRLLLREFRMEDLGDARMFLGIRIDRDSKSGVMKLSQPGYTEAILKRFGMEACKPVSTPMVANLQLQKSSEEKKLEKPYRELIGCLTYLMVTTRPDISAAVSYYSQFQCNPSEEHWSHAKRILRFLRGTTEHGLVYKRIESARQITGFVDANWATDPIDRHSVSGFVFQTYGATTSWSTRKQRTIALSSTESECSALADSICESLWISKLFKELNILDKENVVIYEDNQSAIAIAESEAPSKKLKHTDVKLQFIKECVLKRKVTIQYLPSSEQPADMLTKGLVPATFNKHCATLGIL